MNQPTPSAPAPTDAGETSSEFEARRHATFQRLAADGLDRLDPEHHLLPCRPLTSGLHSQAAGFAIRDSANALVALAMTGHEPQAWQVLERILDHQDTDPASFTRGNFRWYTGWTRVRDPNAASFMVPKLCYVLRHRGAKMPEALRARLEEALRLAVDGLNAHRCAWEYTNIWLLNTASKLMIADVLGDPRARDIGYLDWEEWRNWTGRLGAVPEANCPGYTFVHLDAMALILTCRLDAEFLDEVRAMLRHHLSSVVLDYHERIGVVTGPKSRGSILRRGDAALDTVLHFALDLPEPAGGAHLWLGAPIGPEDVLPIAHHRTLPRFTHSHSHGHRRFNWLADDFAIGGVDGKAGFSPQRTPFFIAHRTSSPRCTVPIEVPPNRAAEGYFADHEGGAMLAAGVWLVPEESPEATATPGPTLKNAWLSRLTGLNCGRPDNLLREGEPCFELSLGELEALTVRAPETGPVALGPGQSVTLESPSFTLTLEHVHIGWRWFSHAGAPTLTLTCQDDGEVRLSVVGSRNDGLPISAAERATMLGMLVEVRPRAEHASPGDNGAELAEAPRPVELQPAEHGWGVSATPDTQRPLSIDVDARPSWLYGRDEQRVTVNRWAQSLRGAALRE